MNSPVVRLPQGAEYDIDLYGDFPLWSVARGLVNGQAQEIEFWNYTRGESVPGITGASARATKLDTNLDKLQGMLGYSEEMMIHAFCWELPMAVGNPATAPMPDHPLESDMKDIMYKTYYSFIINDRIYSEGPINAFPFFGGLYVQSTQNDSEVVNNGVPQSGSVRPLALPIHLTGKSTFRGVLDFPRAGAAGILALVAAGTVDNNQDYKLRHWVLGIRARYQGTTKGA